MRIPQVIFSVGLVLVVVLLLTPRRHPLAYNTSAEVRIQGVVQEVQEFYCPVSGETGTHLKVATEKGTVQVHVAPTRFLSRKQWQFVKGDPVEIVGAAVTVQGRQGLMARTVIRGREVVALREENGKPVWIN